MRLNGSFGFKATVAKFLTFQRNRAELKSLMKTTRLTEKIERLKEEMALSMLAYNLKRVMNIIGIRPLIQAMGALRPPCACR